MACVELKNICKVYKDNIAAVNRFNLKVEDGEFIVLVGPSGCGKSTVLKLIAGLEDITEGDIILNGENINDKLTRDRDVAMIFQSYALYPHLTVYENLAFPLKIKKEDKSIIKNKVEEVSQKLAIDNLLTRKPKTLSGGEKQRVAMGRAIIRNPKLFLMDEPLSNLDAKLRSKLRRELSNLHEELNTTVIYVTHDQVEAMSLGTKIVVINKGIIQQIDTPEKLYNSPCNIFVATFIGSPEMNLINANAGWLKRTKLIIEETEEKVEKFRKLFFNEDKKILLGIRPEKISLEKGETFYLRKVEVLGTDRYGYIEVGERELVTRLNNEDGIKQGDWVNIILRTKDTLFFDKESGNRIELL